MPGSIPRRATVVVSSLVCGLALSALATAACSLGLSGTGTSTGDDGGTPEGSPGEGGECQGLLCNDTCMNGATDCTGCAGAPLLCAATGSCVSDCTAGCSPSAPLECFVCDSTAQNPLGTCHADDVTSNPCRSGDFASAYRSGTPGRRCACAGGNASACPGADEVCASNDTCFECGDLGLTAFDAGACKNGHACDDTTNTCH